MRNLGWTSFLLAAILFNYACKNQKKQSAELIEKPKNVQPVTQYVNAFIGTGGHGHTFPGAMVPNGMVQLSPDTRTEGWDACGGYHYSDNSIKGFSHTHLSGTGIGDLGDFLFMPYTGVMKLDTGTPQDPDSGFRSRFSHDQELAYPGYYTVDLIDYNIKAELTASQRVGFHKYTFNNDSNESLIIDMSHNIHDRNVVNSIIEILDSTEIRGYKHIEGWAPNRHIYFHAKFNKPFNAKIFKNKLDQGNIALVEGRKLLANLDFDKSNGVPLLIKVGISSVDFEGALKNLNEEVKDWNFDKVRSEAENIWLDKLNQFEVEGGTENEKTIFYTALYHTALSPYVFSDIDGRYRGMDQKIYDSTENIYTIFSLWDTFRSFHPLLNITEPELNNDFVNSLLTKYEHGGILPKWELNANYTGTMIGYHSVPVIVDAYFKGVRDFDIEKAYKAMVHASAFSEDSIVFNTEEVKEKLSPKGKKYNEELGYIPSDMENESVAKALEYAYNDWCIAQMAKDLGKEEDYGRFMERSRRYTKYFDKETGFMRGVLKNGQFREPFDPRYSQHRKDDYTEGNAWQWTWFVPHDVNGLVELMGGNEKFTAKLDELFSTSSEITGEHSSSDISGLIGQYAHGNEPSHHITHMYNFVGQSWKTQELTDKIMSTLYFNDPNGLSGNEDCGAMSSWYILNAMGLYSITPGDNKYSIGRPIFNRVSIKLNNGKTFTIVANNNSRANRYVQSVRINGEILAKPFVKHSDIMGGAILEFEMGPEPNTSLFSI